MFRYPGGKSKLKKDIIRYISSFYEEDESHKNAIYIEPFFGAGSIGFNLALHNKIRNACFNDIDIGIRCFWESVINNPEGLCKLVDEFSPSVDSFYDFKEYLLSLDPSMVNGNITEIGFKKMAIHQISYSGLGTKSGGPLGGVDQKSAYTIGCRWNPSHLKSKIRKAHKALNKINLYEKSFFCEDFETIIGKFSGQESFYYLDPPYYEKGTSLYQCSFSNDDHYRLAMILKKMNGPWILSYDDNDKIKEIYDWAFRKEIKVSCTINTKKSSVKNELLITSNEFRYLLEENDYNLKIHFD